MWRSVGTHRAVLAACVAAALAQPGPIAHAQHDLMDVPSCSRGDIGPQMCTLIASTITASWAGVGEYLVLEQVPSEGYVPQCGGYGGRTDTFLGRLRGPHGVATVVMKLFACPREAPSVQAVAYIPKSADSWAVQASTHQLEYVDTLALPVKPAPPRLDFGEGIRWAHESSAAGDIRVAGASYSADADGQTEDCSEWGKEGCEQGTYTKYAVAVTGRGAGHAGELTLAISSAADGRTATVEAEPYGDTGWKITRVA
jgi:hypothetical protein